MIEGAWARAFSERWIAAWNSQNIDSIFSHYSDDFEMRSPYICRYGVVSGVLRGKAAVRPYWELGLAARPQQKFALRQVLVGTDSVVI